MKKIIFLTIFYSTSILSTSAQIAERSSFWIQTDYYNELVHKKNMVNSKEYFNPIKLFHYSNNKLFFQALNSRIAEALYNKVDDDTYIIENIQKNVNLNYFSKEELQNYRFHIKKDNDRLLLIKSNPKFKPDTINYTYLPEMSKIEPLRVIDGYLLLKGNFDMTAHNTNKKESNMTFSMSGEIEGSDFIRYKILNSSILVEDPHDGYANFLIEFQDKSGKRYKKVLLYIKKNELELYDCARNSAGRYELFENSKMSLISN